MASGPGGDNTPSNSDIPRGLINRTGNPIGRGSRLPSVRGSRDLTLGGIQKKVFKPNLTAIKKASSKEELSKQNVSVASPSSSDRHEDSKSANGVKFERGRGRGRGRGQYEDRTIQLQSEFAYGPMGKTASSSGWNRGSGGGGGGGGGGMGGGSGGGGRSNETDSVSMKSTIKYASDTEDDSKLFDSLMRDDFISDLSSGDPNMAPIRLPLNMNRVGVKQEVKSEVKVKEEVMDVDEVDFKVESKSGLGQMQHRSSPPPTNVTEIFSMSAKSEKGELLFIQFPDTLPGLPASALADDRPKSSTTTSSEKEDELVKRLGSCQLKDCTEGYMGKLRVYKSGKAELLLGDNVMEVLPGIPINFHQELVSIHTEDSPGQMIVLGPVSHKLVVTPDYNNLLSHVNKFS